MEFDIYIFSIMIIDDICFSILCMKLIATSYNAEAGKVVVSWNSPVPLICDTRS
jgi:hypothetical protein